MPIYNKLIRDRIPHIIAQTGKKYELRVLDDQEYLTSLQQKCLEEYQEYQSAVEDKARLEELADLLEVIYSLAKVHGATIEELEQIRGKKAVARGSFEEKLFLIKTED